MCVESGHTNGGWRFPVEASSGCDGRRGLLSFRAVATRAQQAQAESTPWRAAILALAATTGLGLAVAAVLLPLPSAAVWSGLTPGDCAEYCEASVRCGALSLRRAIQQPANTWSNLAYAFVGFLAVFRRSTPGSVVFAFSCVLLALGSLLFHATITREFQWLDVVGMYVALAAVAARGLHDGFGVRWSWALAAWAVVSLGLARFKWQLNTTVTMVVLAGVAAAAMARRVRVGAETVATALLPLGLLAAGYGVRALDVNRTFCDPDAWIQGHAIWHLLAAASLHTAWCFFDAGQARTPKRLPDA